jgi:Cellulose binding domain
MPRSPPTSRSSTRFAQGGNHNFFNSVWTPDCWTNPGSCWTDSRGAIPTPATVDDFTAGFSPFPSSDPFCGPAVPGNGRLTSAQQRAVGLAYVAAFFRFHIGGETDFGPLLRGDMPPPATVDPRVFIGFQPPSSRRRDLNRLNDASELLLTTLTGTGGVQGAVTESNLLTFQRCGFDLADPCFAVGAREVHLSNFSGLDPGLSRVRTAWNVRTANFVNEVPPGVRDLRRFDDLQFRVGVDFTDRNNPIPKSQEVTIALSDGISTSTVSTNSQLGINDLFFPPGDPSVTASTVMNTLRLPLSAFSGVNLGDVRSVAVQYNRAPAGTILLSDMSFVADQQARASCEASRGFVVGDRGQVSTPGGGFAVLNAGTGQTQIGRDAHTDGILSVGPVQILDRALVSGDVVSAGTITLSPTATVTGTQTPGGVVSLPPLPALPVFPPPSGSDIFVNSGPTRNLAPGSYPSLTVNSGGSLRLASGTYFFVNLTVNSSSRVEVAADTRVLVKTALAYRTSFVNASSSVQSIFMGFAGTDATLEAVFNGTLVAPNAHVAFGVAAGLPYTGTFFAQSLEVRPGSSLLCTAGPTGPSGSAMPTCTDGIRNGAETGVDCGGPVCPQCPAGQGCVTGSDCVTGVCTGGICQPPSGSVTATRAISADWGFGYCATLFVRNNTSLPTIRWSVSVDTNQSTIYTSWNGIFSGSSGVVSVAPAFDWNRVIQPGATDGSVGFCANRNVPGSGVLPVVQGASGTF